MNWRTISRNIGAALLVSALFMFLSVIVSILNGHDSALAPLSISFLITFLVGSFPFIFVRRSANLTLKEGYMIIFLSWFLSFIFGMLPYALWGGPFTVENAWFESVSGFTTTGSTILEDIEALPKSLLFWRSATHFIGGLGVVVFLLLVIPNSSPIRMRLTNMEVSSLSKDGYSTRANKTVAIFAYVYIGIFVLALVSYWIAGMSFFDAVCHAFSVCATGGFSTKNLSIGYFDSRAIEILTMVFMYLSTLHFGLIFLAFANRSLRPLNNPVVKFYTFMLLAVSVIVSMSLRLDGAAQNWSDAIRYGFFQTFCVASTTGFGIVDNAGWPLFPGLLLMVMAVICGCAGSTTGGVKSDRVLVLLKCIARQVGKILHPSLVGEIKLGKRVLRDDEVYPHVLYIALYGIVLVFSVIAAKALGVNDHSSIAASVSSLGNVGPAIRELGFMGNFDSVPSGAKVLFTIDMFLGRIEIYPVMAVLGMIFDRSGRRR